LILPSITKEKSLNINDAFDKVEWDFELVSKFVVESVETCIDSSTKLLMHSELALALTLALSASFCFLHQRYIGEGEMP